MPRRPPRNDNAIVYLLKQVAGDWRALVWVGLLLGVIIAVIFVR